MEWEIAQIGFICKGGLHIFAVYLLLAFRRMDGSERDVDGSKFYQHQRSRKTKRSGTMRWKKTGNIGKA